MLKVIVIERCEYCDGEAYVYSHDRTDFNGEVYRSYKPCYMCKGTGELEKRVPVREFLIMLENATSMEPDFAELGKEKVISQYQDSRDAAGI